MITVIMTSTKPANVAWFHESSPENADINQQVHSWTMEQPGVLSHRIENPDENTRVTTIEFDTVENYANWATARGRLPTQTARVAYNIKNRITSRTNETLS